jgi:hypothetical protein
MPTLFKVHPDGREELKEQGGLCNAIEWNEDGTSKGIAGHRPIVGCSLMVGSSRARSYSDQDYWLTTTVTEILEETDKHVTFRTKNSKYKLIL